MQSVQRNRFKVKVVIQEIGNTETRLRDSRGRMVVGLRQHMVKLMGKQASERPSVKIILLCLRLMSSRGCQETV